MKINFRLVLLSSLVLTVFLMAGCGGNNYDTNVRLVREGHLEAYPNIPVGKAFDQFFINDSWKSFTSTEKEKIVEFNGECTFDNAPATLKVQFAITGNYFRVHYVGLNNVPLNDFDGLSVLDKVLSEYKP